MINHWKTSPFPPPFSSQMGLNGVDNGKLAFK